jgi:hypothetical protein
MRVSEILGFAFALPLKHQYVIQQFIDSDFLGVRAKSNFKFQCAAMWFHEFLLRGIGALQF